MTQPLYQPSQERIDASRIHEFMRHVNQAHGLALDTFDQLYVWSLDDPGAFWGGGGRVR